MSETETHAPPECCGGGDYFGHQTFCDVGHVRAEADLATRFKAAEYALTVEHATAVVYRRALSAVMSAPTKAAAREVAFKAIRMTPSECVAAATPEAKVVAKTANPVRPRHE